LKCCADDDKMKDYVQNQQYGDRFPVPAMPTPSCEHDAKDSKDEGELCGKCEGAVNVELEAIDCPFPTVADEDEGFIQIADGTVADAAAAQNGPSVFDSMVAAATDAEKRDFAAVDAMSLEQILSEVKALRKAHKLPCSTSAAHSIGPSALVRH
jgi:hypothetical protein